MNEVVGYYIEDWEPFSRDMNYHAVPYKPAINFKFNHLNEGGVMPKLR